MSWNVIGRVRSRLWRALESRVRRSTWYQEQFLDCSKFWGQISFNLDVINLGSTSGLHAFNYEGLPVKAMNWALCQNPLSADLAILENYSSYLKPRGAVVIFPLCPFSSLAGSYGFYDDRYYTFLYPSSIPGYSSRRRDRILAVKNNPAAYYPCISFFDELVAALNRKLGRGCRLQENVDMDADAQNWMRGWKLEFSLKDFSVPLSLVNQDAIKDACLLLKKMIAFCREHDCRPVFVVPPVFHTLSVLFTNEARALLLNDVVRTLKEERVEFFDYLDARPFSQDESLFRNAFLLNDQGAKLFTRQVLTDLGLVK